MTTDKKPALDIRITGDNESVAIMAKALGVKIYPNKFGGARIYFEVNPEEEKLMRVCQELNLMEIITNAQEDVKDAVEGQRAEKTERSAKQRGKRRI